MSSVLVPQSLPSAVLVAVALVSIVVFGRSTVVNYIQALLSHTINNILCNRHQIKHTEKGTDLPSLPYVFPNGQGNVEKFLHGRANSAKWESEHGPLYRLWSGTKGEVVLTKPAHVELVFRDSHKHSKAQANNSGYVMDRLLGSCVGLISGESWSTVKSGVEAPFLHRSAGAYVEDVQQFTRSYMQALTTYNKMIGGYGKIHAVHDLKLLPFLFVARIVYGPLDVVLEGELKQLIILREQVFKSVINGGISRFPISRFLPLAEIRALNEFKDRWADWSDRAHAAAFDAARVIAPPVISMYEAVDDGTITREQLLQTLDEMLFANIDVTMGGLSWTLVFLATHPPTQNALRHEISAHSSDPAARKAYLLSTFTSTPTLLGACILESARLRPLAAFSVPQSCPTPRVLDGYEIPADTNFVIDSYALNIRDPFWGEDRDKFQPQRWLERQKSGRDLRYRYWRFGFGPRTCMGKYVAELILRSVVVDILENWQISLDAGVGKGEKGKGADGDGGEMNWPWDDEMWIHHPDLFLSCAPLTEKTG